MPSGHPSKAHVVVAVAQKYECYRSRMMEEEQVGFCIYEVPPGNSQEIIKYQTISNKMYARFNT